VNFTFRPPGRRRPRRPGASWRRAGAPPRWRPAARRTCLGVAVTVIKC
jgi:hypothetical protein